MSELFERLRQEVQEIADVLARETGKSPTEVWEEALSLHRVRYETVPLPVEPAECPPDTQTQGPVKS